MNTLSKRKILFFYVFMFFSFSTMAVEEIHHMDKSTQQASELTKRMTIADPAEKIILLEKLKILVTKKPDNIWVRKMYVNNLIAEKHYQQGLAGLEVIIKQRFSRIDLLTECMLKERLGHRDEACYQKVIQLSEKDNLVDSDYITALFFTDSPKFETLKSTLIKEKQFSESDFLVFTLGKEKMLHEFFP
ncbi:hypothetical protein [uncultured Erwinia sp.]|uniref:hypothetical protein n=1 Tax=uncultured Erwinia sp. TaxID=246798 RepID=UPI002585CCD7|nr:hypothetical protein [uncultured Erwinia sp.]